jgi:hypothetical protein
VSTPQLPSIPDQPLPVETVPAPLHNADTRWAFIRDVAVFEFKLALNNFHNFFQIPLTLVVAAIDLIFTEKGKMEGSRFYKVVEWGRTIDDAIDIYSVVDHVERSMNTTYTVDTLVSKLETVIVREHEKGGTAANIKAALDRAIDEMQAKGGPVAARTEEALKRAAERMRSGMPGDEPPPANDAQ